MASITNIEKFKIKKYGLLKCAQDVYKKTGRTYPVKKYVIEQTGYTIKEAVEYVHRNIHNPIAELINT